MAKIADEPQAKPESKTPPIASAPISHDRGPTATSAGSEQRGSPTVPSGEPSPTKPTGKAKIVETIRVESDRLDHLMNLAGELVITKARFVAIARGLDELFRGSNARALTSDTRERLESLTRGLEGLAEIKSDSAELVRSTVGLFTFASSATTSAQSRMSLT